LADSSLTGFLNHVLENAGSEETFLEQITSQSSARAMGVLGMGQGFAVMQLLQGLASVSRGMLCEKNPENKRGGFLNSLLLGLQCHFGSGMFTGLSGGIVNSVEQRISLKTRNVGANLACPPVVWRVFAQNKRRSQGSPLQNWEGAFLGSQLSPEPSHTSLGIILASKMDGGSPEPKTFTARPAVPESPLNKLLKCPVDAQQVDFSIFVEEVLATRPSGIAEADYSVLSGAASSGKLRALFRKRPDLQSALAAAVDGVRTDPSTRSLLKQMLAGVLPPDVSSLRKEIGMVLNRKRWQQEVEALSPSECEVLIQNIREPVHESIILTVHFQAALAVVLYHPDLQVRGRMKEALLRWVSYSFSNQYQRSFLMSVYELQGIPQELDKMARLAESTDQFHNLVTLVALSVGQERSMGRRDLPGLFVHPHPKVRAAVSFVLSSLLPQEYSRFFQDEKIDGFYQSMMFTHPHEQGFWLSILNDAASLGNRRAYLELRRIAEEQASAPLGELAEDFLDALNHEGLPPSLAGVDSAVSMRFERS